MEIEGGNGRDIYRSSRAKQRNKRAITRIVRFRGKLGPLLHAWSQLPLPPLADTLFQDKYRVAPPFEFPSASFRPRPRDTLRFRTVKDEYLPLTFVVARERLSLWWKTWHD